jgi:Ca2+-binding RTX toxin-like protein
MATPSQLTALKQLYTGIFGFLPTTEAFDWYAAQIDRLGLDTAGLANVLLYDDTQAGASNTFDYSGGDTAFVRQVYQNLFGWTDAALELAEHVEGVAYWTAQLNGVFGGDKGKLIEAMIWVVETTGLNSADVSTRQAFALLQNYLEVSTYALEQAKAAGEDLDLDVLRSAYDVVTGNAASFNAAKTLIDTSGKAIYGTDASETLNGTRKNDAILALAGDDVINAGAGDDWINTGYSGNNVVTGGRGDDQIEGGPQDDVYIFNRGDGQDVLFDHGGADVLRFGTVNPWSDPEITGMPPPILPSDITLTRQGNDLLLDFENGDQVRLNNQFGSGYDIETLQFEVGSTVDLAALVAKATAAGDLREGVAYSLTDLLGPVENDEVLVIGDDALAAFDWLLWYSGVDGGSVYTGSLDFYDYFSFQAFLEQGPDSLYLPPYERAYSYHGDSIFIDDSIRYFGHDSILIARDGADFILVGGTHHNNMSTNSFLLIGGNGNDELNSMSSSGPSVFYGGKGNEALIGSAYYDVYAFSRGDGADLLLNKSVRFDDYEWGDLESYDIILFDKGIDVQDLRLSLSFDRLNDTFQSASGASWTVPPLRLHYTSEDYIMFDSSWLWRNSAYPDEEGHDGIAYIEFRDDDTFTSIDFIGVLSNFHAALDAGNISEGVEYQLTDFL